MMTNKNAALYGTGNGNYDMLDVNNTYLGSCNRPAVPQEMDCWELISATFLTHVFTCKCARNSAIPEMSALKHGPLGTSDLVPNDALFNPWE